MNGTPNDDPRSALLDPVRLAEIRLLTALMIAATMREGPLEQHEIDSLLEEAITA